METQTLVLKDDFQFAFKGYWGKPAICHILRYRASHRDYIVMVELPDNPGTSVTNAIEYIIPQLAKKIDIIFEATDFFESYLQYPVELDKVIFKRNKDTGEISNVNWQFGFSINGDMKKSITIDDLKALLESKGNNLKLIEEPKPKLTN